MRLTHYENEDVYIQYMRYLLLLILIILFLLTTNRKRGVEANFDYKRRGFASQEFRIHHVWHMKDNKKDP